jgi:ABC-type branched-subunit amino acid transport system substrate-binding protein
MHDRIARQAAPLALAVVVALHAACGALLSFEECAVDGDCAARGDGLLCSEEGYCVLPESAGLGESCTTSACVAQEGENYVCGRGGRCVQATTPQCTQVFGPIDRDNTLILGSILPTVGDFAGIGAPIERAVQLAVEEINDAGGLPGGRRLVVIGCDSSGNRDQGLEVARHLVEVVGVPAIIGPAFSGIFIDVVTEVSAPGGAMTVSPAATSYLITELDDQDLAWRTVASDVFQGAAIADLVREQRWQRLIVLGKGDAYGKGLLLSVTNELAVDLGEDGFVGFEYADPGGDTPPDLGGLVTDALAQQPAPDVILLLGTSEIAEILNLFELALEDSPNKPLYVLADGGRDADALFPILEARPELLARVSGTAPDHENGQIFESFSLRYRQKFRELPGIYAANAYDGVYLLTYGFMAQPAAAPTTGAGLVQSMGRMIKGREVEAGPEQIAEARNTLTGGGTIDFQGASGALNFIIEDGEAPADVSQWDVERRENGELRFRTVRNYTLNADGQGAW